MGRIHACYFNSEGFLAEVFHPWVRWEGPGSGFENSSGGGVWAHVGGPKLGPRGWAQAGPTWVGSSRAHVGGPKPAHVGSPSRAHVGGPKLGPRGWAQAEPKWVGPLWIEVETPGFRTAWLITGRKIL